MRLIFIFLSNSQKEQISVQLHFFKILFQVLQQSRNPLCLHPQHSKGIHSWQDKSHWIGCTLDLFLEWFTLWFLSNLRSEKNSRRAKWNQTSVVWLWKVPLVNWVLASYWQHQTNKWIRRNGRGRPLDMYGWRTDRHVMLTYITFAHWERERGNESNRTCVVVTGVCPSPLRLLHLSGIWGSNWCCQTHREGQNTHTHKHTHTHSCPSACTPRA